MENKKQKLSVQPDGLYGSNIVDGFVCTKCNRLCDVDGKWVDEGNHCKPEMERKRAYGLCSGCSTEMYRKLFNL